MSCKHLSCQFLCCSHPLSSSSVSPFHQLLLSCHLTSLFPIHLHPSLSPHLHHTSFKLMERTICCDMKVCFCPVSAHRNKKSRQNNKWEMPFCCQDSLNDIPVIPVRTSGSCYRNVSPSSSTCSRYRDNTSCDVAYRLDNLSLSCNKRPHMKTQAHAEEFHRGSATVWRVKK